METMTHRTDVAVIGAGPVGLFAVFECGMLRMKCHVVDALSAVGGQCTALYPEKPIYDIPGFPSIAAQGLIDNLAAQAEPFAPTLHLGQQVMSITGDATAGFTLTTDKGTVIEARAIVIAAGVGAFRPKRPPLDGIEALEGRHVHYFVQRRQDFAGKRIVIAGGGDSAVDWALSLAEVAAHVSLVHRRAKFRAAPESAAQLEALAAEGRIDLVTPYQLHSLTTLGDELEAVVLEDLDGGRRTLAADHLLAFFGLEMTLGPIADWGLNLEKAHIAVDPATMETSVPGIFAVGDIAIYRNKLKLILSGFHEGATAAHAIHPLLNPGQVLHFEYSTSKGAPGTAS